MKRLITGILCFASSFLSAGSYLEEPADPLIARETVVQDIFLETKEIVIPGFKDAFNPSLIESEQGLLLTFRYLADPTVQLSISEIYVVVLNDDFSLKSAPQKLKTRGPDDLIQSQSEDARLFRYKGSLWVLYNDNVESLGASFEQRRDMYIAKVDYKKGRFTLGPPLKIIHQSKWANVLWQKNWVPFEWEGNLLMSYSLNPHEVLLVDMNTGVCKSLFETNPPLKWHFGALRGGTPAEVVDGEYFGIFHSSKYMSSVYSQGKMMHHYFMGGYTFSKDPPFQFTKISKNPLIHPDLYAPTAYGKRVVFPGGFVVRGDKVLMALGKDDHQVWIVTMDKAKLLETLSPLN